MIPHAPCTDYKIILTPTASKSLSKLNKQSISVILKKIKELALGKHNLDIKKLKSSEILYRLRVGDYRVIYRIAQKIITVYIVDIGHRKDIYKLLTK